MLILGGESVNVLREVYAAFPALLQLAVNYTSFPGMQVMVSSVDKDLGEVKGFYFF